MESCHGSDTLVKVHTCIYNYKHNFPAKTKKKTGGHPAEGQAYHKINHFLTFDFMPQEVVCHMAVRYTVTHNDEF